MVIFDDRHWKPKIEKQEQEILFLCSNTVELLERIKEKRFRNEDISESKNYLLKNLKFLKEEISKYERCFKNG